MATVDVTNQPVVVEATNDVAVVSFTENSAVVEVPNPQPVVEFTAGGTLTAGTGLVGGGYLTGAITLGLSPAAVASLAKADSAVQPGANLSSFVNDLNLATSSVLTDAIAALSTVYQPLNANLTSVAGLLTTAFGRSFLELADAAASRSLIGVYSTSQVYTKSEVNVLVAAGLIPVWGTITGNILDQTDLQFALSAKSSIGHDHVAAAITSGVLAPARLGSGVADNTKYLRGDGTWSVFPTVTADHGTLTGLGDDDHTQYHTDARGDARYSLLAHTHSYLPLAGGFVTGALVLDGAGYTSYRNATNTVGADIGMLGGSADPGLYIYQRHNGIIHFGTNNATRMTIAADGVVNVVGALRVGGTNVSLDGHTHGAGGLAASLTSMFHSGSDFPAGTLVATDIDATPTDGASFIVEITGKSYSGTNPPTKAIIQGYFYADSIISASGLSYGGTFASSVKLMNDGGVLKIWWPNVAYWHSYNVRVYNATGPTDGNVSRNRVTGITNAAEPTGSKKVTVTLATAWTSHSASGGTMSGALTVQASISSTGADSTLWFNDRSGVNSNWAWYSQDGLTARLYATGYGDVFTFNRNGNLGAPYVISGKFAFNTEVFTFDGDTVPHYGIAWYGDSRNTGGNSLAFSGYGGLTFITAGSERMRVDGVDLSLSVPIRAGFVVAHTADTTPTYMTEWNQPTGASVRPIYLRFHQSSRWYARIKAEATLLSYVNGADDGVQGLAASYIQGNSYSTVNANTAYKDGYGVIQFGQAAVDSTNFPEAVNNAQMYMWWGSHTGPYGKQFFFTDSENLWIRKVSAGSWGAWRKIWHDGIFTPSSYLPLSGGLMTGQIVAVSMSCTGNGGDSGVGGGAYTWGYQTAGAWVHPYPDLVLGYHTGVRMGGNSSYGGIRFYNDHPQMSGTEIFSVGNGDNHVRAAYNFYAANSITAGYNITLGSGYGIYLDGGSSVYIADRASNSYGSIRVGGSKNAWAGIFFDSAYQGNGFMMNTGGNQMGFYSETGSWKWYYDSVQFYVQGSTKAVPYCDWGGGGKMTWGTGTPTGGADGDIHYQYT